MRTLITEACMDKKFKLVYEEGLQAGLIEPWDEELIDKIKKLNVFSGGSFSFLSVFVTEGHIGQCFSTSRVLSFLYDEFEQVFGILPAIIGTPGAPKGEHVWLVVGDYLYDTSLMLKIHTSIASRLGYQVISVRTHEYYANDLSYEWQREQSKEDNSWAIELEEQVEKLARTL